MSRRNSRKVTEGIAYIHATFNNTIVSIGMPNGDVLRQKSAGECGFKGSRKGTPFAAQVAAEQLAKYVQETFGMKRIPF